MRDRAGSQDLAAVVEALLFSAARPLTEKELLAAMGTADRRELRAALELLGARLEAGGSALELVEVAKGWRLQTRPEYAPYIKRLRQGQPRRMSRAALETLALVAYQQPVTRAEIEAVRGVDSSGTIKFLLEQGLIRMAGRKEAPGRPILYATTARFLELFQLNDLKDLPSLEELKELEQEEKGQATLPMFGAVSEGSAGEG